MLFHADGLINGEHHRGKFKKSRDGVIGGKASTSTRPSLGAEQIQKFPPQQNNKTQQNSTKQNEKLTDWRDFPVAKGNGRRAETNLKLIESCPTVGTAARANGAAVSRRVFGAVSLSFYSRRRLVSNVGAVRFVGAPTLRALEINKSAIGFLVFASRIDHATRANIYQRRTSETAPRE